MTRPRLLAALGPYLPAALTITLALTLATVYRRELADWMAGRPFGEAALSRPRTIDVGPLRVALATRPATPVAGEPLDLFLGVGDALGAVIDDASATTRDGLPVEARGRGQLTVVVPMPEEGARELTLDLHAGDARGEVTLELTPGQPLRVRGEAPSGVAWWTCSMHPSVHAPDDGLCPICRMELTPVTHEELASGAVRLDARRRQLIGVTTAPVTRGTLHLEAHASGVVRLPEGALRDVTPRVVGWFDAVHVEATGQEVRAGELLAELSSPELFALQAEYLAASRRGGELGLGEAVAALRTRLRLVGQDAAALAARGRADGRIGLRAPIAGTIVARDAVAGAPAAADRPAFRIAALDPVWIDTRVHEGDAPLAEVGAAARVSFAFRPSVTREARVSVVLPALDPETRTLVARLVLDNPAGAERLLPDMLADVVLVKELADRVIVPAEAVIWTGPRRLVFVDRGDGRLAPVDVEVGARGREGYEVVRGLAPGDVVVTSGQFLIGAESRLRSALGAW